MSGASPGTSRAQPNGWWGMALLIAGEATFFGCLIAAYFYLRFNGGQWPPPGVEPPAVPAPLLLTGGLLLSVAPLAAAVRAAAAGRARATWWLVAVATAIQAAYLAFQVELFSTAVGEIAPTASAYGSAYLTLLGAHHLHVALGLCFDAWLLAKLLGGLNRYRLTAVRVVALYWAFVAAVAVPVVLTQLSPSL